MRNKFFEYYPPTKQQLDKMWEEGLIVFDTNVLLNFYRYSTDTSEKFLDVLKEIKEKIWLPYNVVYEFQKKRLDVIHKQMNSYDKIISYIDSQLNSINGKLNKYKKHRFLNITELKEKLKANLESIKEEVKEKKIEHPNWFTEDKIREKLTIIFDGKIGKKYDKETLEKIYEEGEERYKNLIPPGYKDKDKNDRDNYDKYDNREYGDLVIWKQIIEIAKNENKSIIFVTDDQKEDWWWQDYGKTFGPRYELIREIYEKAEVMFHMYRPERFLEFANDYLENKIESNVIDEVEELSNKEEYNKMLERIANLRQKIDEYKECKYKLEREVDTLNEDDIHEKHKYLQYKKEDLLKEKKRISVLYHSDSMNDSEFYPKREELDNKIDSVNEILGKLTNNIQKKKEKKNELQFIKSKLRDLYNNLNYYKDKIEKEF